MIESINLYDNLKSLKGSTTGDVPGRLTRGRNFQGMLDEAVAADEISATAVKKKTVDKRLMDACVEMESLFVAKMLKEMRKTVHKGEMLHGGFAEEIFEDMLYDEYALSLSKNSSIGLAKMVYDQLSAK